MRPVDITVEVLLGDAASLRFSMILQQTMLCATRIEPGTKALYEGYTGRLLGDRKVAGGWLTGASARTRIVERLRADSVVSGSVPKANRVPYQTR